MGQVMADSPIMSSGAAELTFHPPTAQAPGPAASVPAVIVMPGGSYTFLAPHEGEPAAQWLNQLGFAAWVLEYPVGPHPPDANRHTLHRFVQLFPHMESPRLHAHARPGHTDPTGPTRAAAGPARPDRPQGRTFWAKTTSGTTPSTAACLNRARSSPTAPLTPRTPTRSTARLEMAR
jgi:hypothetical protein